jgi:hypothetical protein
VPRRNPRYCMPPQSTIQSRILPPGREQKSQSVHSIACAKIPAICALISSFQDWRRRLAARATCICSCSLHMQLQPAHASTGCTYAAACAECRPRARWPIAGACATVCGGTSHTLQPGSGTLQPVSSTPQFGCGKPVNGQALPAQAHKLPLLAPFVFATRGRQGARAHRHGQPGR